MTAKRKYLKPAALAATAMLLAACGSGNDAAGSNGAAAESLEEMEPVTLTIAEFLPTGDYLADPLAEYAAEVEERTDGKITFEEYYGASLAGATDILPTVSSGTADLGRVVATYHPQELPISNWVQDLGSTNAPNYPHGMLQGSATSHELFTTNEEILDEYAAQNVLPLTAYNPSQEYSLSCNTPVEGPEDASGIRARVAGETWSKEAEAMGIEPVNVDINETYEGMQRGVIDCALLPMGSVMGASIWEVTDYFSPVISSQVNAMPLVMNNDTWESLPEDAQEIMREAALDVMWESSVTGVLEAYGDFEQQAINEGDTEILDPTGFDDVLTEHQESVVDDMVNTAPDGVSNPQAFVDDYLAAQDHWLDTTVESLNMELTDRSPEALVEGYRSNADLDISTFTEAVSNGRG